MIRIRAPEGEPVQVIFAHGETLYCRYDPQSLRLEVRVEAPDNRRLMHWWWPRDVVRHVKEQVMIHCVRQMPPEQKQEK